MRLRFLCGLMGAMLLAGSLLNLPAPVRSADDDVTAEQRKLFEEEIFPLLKDNCLRCHGDKKQESGLRLDSRQALLDGGQNGPAIVLGKPDESLLVKVLVYDGDIQMPPDAKLEEDKVEQVRKWVKQEAPWPKKK